jgi:ABC-type branched-subunit amino acid transport system substrate-binding protein
MRFALLLLATVLFAGCSNSDAGKPIELGHVHPSNSDDAEYKALKLAVEELNRDPGALPLGRRLQIRHAPGGVTPDEFGSQATRLIALNKVHGLIAADRSAFAERVGLAVQGENLVAISPAGWPGASQNLFAVGLAPVERGRVLALVAKDDPKSQSAGVLILRDPTAKAANIAADRFAADCRAFVRLTEMEITDPNKPTAGAVFFACSARVAVQHRDPYRNALCLFGDEDAELTALIESGSSADGFHVATAHDPSLKEDRLGVFANRFQLANGSPPSAASMMAYDAISVWVEAARRAKSLDVGTMRTELRNRAKPFDVLTGTLTFADDQSARRPVFVGRITNGMIERKSVHEPAN